MKLLRSLKLVSTQPRDIIHFISPLSAKRGIVRSWASRSAENTTQATNALDPSQLSASYSRERLNEQEYLLDFSLAGNFIREDFLVFPEFVTEDEAQSLFEEINPVLLRSRYDEGHWDRAIQFYREIHRTKWSEKNAYLRERVQRISQLQQDGIVLSSAVHVLDLMADKGAVLPHVDSIDYVRIQETLRTYLSCIFLFLSICFGALQSLNCRTLTAQVGKTVCGLSLLSPSVMCLQHTSTK